MAKAKKETNIPSSDVELENARVGYQLALTMVTELMNVIWSIFNTMLVANSIVVAGISLILSSKPSDVMFFKIILSTIGLVICLMWFFIVKRHRDYLAYYMMSARELEEKYLSNGINFLSRGGVFARGKEVKLQINGKEHTQRMSFWARSIRGESASSVIIIVFVIIYISVLFI